MANNEEMIKAWYAMRRATIHEQITAHDILRMNGVTFRHTSDREEQFSCPFHGKDAKPSARVYPAKADSRSHVWCYVCQKSWDAISLWKKYSGDENGHHRILTEMEKHLGITPPKVPEGTHDLPQVDTRAKDLFTTLLDLCEHRLRTARDSYFSQEDMAGFLIAGSILDKLTFRIAEGKLAYEKANELLKQLIDKIGDRIRGEAH